MRSQDQPRRCKRSALIQTRVVGILLFSSAVAFAACVNGYPAVQKEQKSSELVFSGKVIGQHKMPASGDEYFLDGDTYTVVPTHFYKGGAKGKWSFSARTVQVSSQCSFSCSSMKTTAG